MPNVNRSADEQESNNHQSRDIGSGLAQKDVDLKNATGKLNGDQKFGIIRLSIIFLGILLCLFLIINKDNSEIQKVFITSLFALFGGGAGGIIGVTLK
jgi:hypothetical protein